MTDTPQRSFLPSETHRPYDKAAADKALSRAKIALMQAPNSAFFTTVCFSMRHRFDSRIGTAGTDGLNVWYGPDFFLALSTEEQVFVVLHETLHIAYLHRSRMGSRDKMLWNIACDHVINLQLVERGFKLPTIITPCCDERFKGMSAEEVYDTLLSEAIVITIEMPDLDEGALPEDLRDKNRSQAPGGQDGQKPASSPGQTLEQQVADILIRASLQSRMAGDKAGSIPGDIQLYLDRLLNPKLPWTTILRRYMQRYSRSDYSFKRANRRFFPRFHLPSLHAPALLHLCFAVDISGSVCDEDFKSFISEIHGVMKQFRPDRITLVQFDTVVQHVDVLRSVNDLMRVEFTGRGGTWPQAVLNWARQEPRQPDVVLFFTDGEFPLGQDYENLKSDIVWLIHNNTDFTSPTGKVIHYELEHASAG